MAVVGARISGRERAIDLLDVVGDALRLSQQLLGPLDRRLKLLQRRVWQVREISRLIDQHLRLVLQRRDLVVDLLQLARRSQDILGIVVGIEDDPLRRLPETGTVSDSATELTPPDDGECS